MSGIEVKAIEQTVTDEMVAAYKAAYRQHTDACILGFIPSQTDGITVEATRRGTDAALSAPPSPVDSRDGLEGEAFVFASEIIRGFLDCPEIADCAPEDLDNETRDLERRARRFLSTSHVKGYCMFEIIKDFELEVIGSGRSEWVIPTPTPRCKLAVRKDTKEWFVATGVYYKLLESIDGTTFRDSDGCTWQLLRKVAAKEQQP